MLTVTKTVTQALALLKREPHQRDPEVISGCPNKHPCATLLDIFKPSTSRNKSSKMNRVDFSFKPMSK